MSRPEHDLWTVKEPPTSAELLDTVRRNKEAGISTVQLLITAALKGGDPESVIMQVTQDPIPIESGGMLIRGIEADPDELYSTEPIEPTDITRDWPRRGYVVTTDQNDQLPARIRTILPYGFETG